MSIERLRRILWRVRSRSKGSKVVSYAELRRCIIIECGTSPQTYYNNMDAMRTLGWIKRHRTRIVLTDKDLSEDF